MFFAQMMPYWDAAQTICFCPEDDGRYYQDEVVILISLAGHATRDNPRGSAKTNFRTNSKLSYAPGLRAGRAPPAQKRV
jgi:hypothetical protein